MGNGKLPGADARPTASVGWEVESRIADELVILDMPFKHTKLTRDQATKLAAALQACAELLPRGTG